MIRRIGSHKDRLGECPLWCVKEEALYYVDIYAPAVRRYDPKSDSITSWYMPESVGSIALTVEGDLLVALRSCIRRFDPRSGKLGPVLAHAPDPRVRFNDGRVGPDGCFWVGTMQDPPN